MLLARDVVVMARLPRLSLERVLHRLAMVHAKVHVAHHPNHRHCGEVGSEWIRAC